MPDEIICTAPLSGTLLLPFCRAAHGGPYRSPVADGDRRKGIVDVLGADSKPNQE